MRLGATDTPCPEFVANIGGKLRTIDNPCGTFCNTPDFRHWKALALSIIKNAIIARTDLPARTREVLVGWQAELQSMKESVFSVGDDTRYVAQIAYDAHCILYSKPGEEPHVNPPLKPSNPVDGIINKGFLVIGAGILFWVWVNKRPTR